MCVLAAKCVRSNLVKFFVRISFSVVVKELDFALTHMQDNVKFAAQVSLLV